METNINIKQVDNGFIVKINTNAMFAKPTETIEVFNYESQMVEFINEILQDNYLKNEGLVIQIVIKSITE